MTWPSSLRDRSIGIGAGVALAVASAACRREQPPPEADAYVPTWSDTGPDDAYLVRPDAPLPDTNQDASSECAARSVGALIERLPVDIIWVVDNSVSMAPAVREVTAGLNRFATLVATAGSTTE